MNRAAAGGGRPARPAPDQVARMVRSHRELILSWFRARGQLSNAIVEGFNGKAR